MKTPRALSILLLLAVACAPVASSQPTANLSLQTPSASPQPSRTAQPTPTHVLADAGLSGELWAYIDNEYSLHFKVTDLETGSVRIVDIPDKCQPLPVSNDYLLCLELYYGLFEFEIYFPARDRWIPLGSIDAGWFSQSPGGRFLVYPITESDEFLRLGIIDTQLSKRLQITLPAEISDGNYRSFLPTLSADGEFLATGSVTEDLEHFITIYSVDSGDWTMIQYLAYSNNFPDAFVSWSPQSHQLLVGTLGSPNHVPDNASQFHLIDIDKDTVTRIQPTPSFYEYRAMALNQTIWSPSGDLAVLATQDEYCIVTVASATQQCTLVEDGIDRAPVWSPFEEYFLYYAYRADPSGAYFIVNAFTGQVVKLEDSDSPRFIWWVP